MSVSLKRPRSAVTFAPHWMELRHREEVRDRLRQLMLEQGVSAEALADAVGVKERTARYWISPSKPGGIQYENVKKAAKFFGVSVSWLWVGREQEPAPDVIGALSNDGNLSELKAQLDRIEEQLAENQDGLVEILNHVDAGFAAADVSAVDLQSAPSESTAARESASRGKSRRARG